MVGSYGLPMVCQRVPVCQQKLWTCLLKKNYILQGVSSPTGQQPTNGEGRKRRRPQTFPIQIPIFCDTTMLPFHKVSVRSMAEVFQLKIFLPYAEQIRFCQLPRSSCFVIQGIALPLGDVKTYNSSRFLIKLQHHQEPDCGCKSGPVPFRGVANIRMVLKLIVSGVISSDIIAETDW